MALWTGQRLSDALDETWTTGVYPDYVIQHFDGSDHYKVWSSAGPIGNRSKFAEAERLVIEDAKLVASASQVNLKKG